MSIQEADTTQKLTKDATGIGNAHRFQDPTVQKCARHAQLRRMPHVFCKSLDLPFPAETRVAIDERKDAYAFVIQQPGLQEADVVAETVEIVPGAIKVILRGADRIRAALTKSQPSSAEMANWRARLPMGTIPERAKATYAHGVVTIIIPKLPAAAAAAAAAAKETRSRGPKNSRCPSELLCLV